MIVYKLFWHLKDGVTLQKADLPTHYKVDYDKKDWSKKKLKKYLENKHLYKLKKMEKI